MKTIYTLFWTTAILLALSACSGAKKGAAADGQPNSNIQPADMAPPAAAAAGPTFSAITFEPALAQLDTGGRRAVGKLAAYLLENPSKGVQLTGFATEFTRSKLNESLAAQRVGKVVDTLLQLKVSPSQIGNSANPAFERILPGTVRWGRTNFRVEVEIRAKERLVAGESIKRPVSGRDSSDIIEDLEAYQPISTNKEALFRIPYARPSAEITIDSLPVTNKSDVSFWFENALEVFQKAGFKKTETFNFSGSIPGWAIATEPQFFRADGTPENNAYSAYSPPSRVKTFEQHLAAYSRVIRERNGLTRIFVLTCSNRLLPRGGREFVYNDKKGSFELTKDSGDAWKPGNSASDKYALRLLVYEFGSAPGKLPKQLFDVRKASLHVDMSGLSNHLAELSNMQVPSAAPTVDLAGDKPYPILNPEPFKPLNPNDYHVVAAGDTLYNISKRYKLTVDQLKKLNNLASNDIEIGQYLRIR